MPITAIARRPRETAVPPAVWEPAPVILSFDVEEHDRIEAAAGMSIPMDLRRQYSRRVGPPTQWLLDVLDRAETRATFFVVGQLVQHHAGLVRAIARAGHEVASHGWDHRRVHHFSPNSFRADIRRSRQALEQVTGRPVLGYRAPTFSIVRQTAWAVDVLAEEGIVYDSSIYPVRHDRYGVPRAPRGPFLVRGTREALLELPPATLRVCGINTPMGGGGYFRLFPPVFTRWAIRQMRRQPRPAVAHLYFHPWEFDPDQPRLPLGRLSRFRTYVGVRHTRGRLCNLLGRYPFARAIDVARWLEPHRQVLPCFDLVA